MKKTMLFSLLSLGLIYVSFAQKKATQATDGIYGPYTNTVSVFTGFVDGNKKVIEKDRQHAIDIPTDIKKFNKQSLQNLAVGNKYSAAGFQSLLILVASSTEMNDDKTAYTDNAHYAQKALTDLAPIDPATTKPVSIQTYSGWIIDVARSTKDKHDALMQELLQGSDDGYGPYSNNVAAIKNFVNVNKTVRTEKGAKYAINIPDDIKKFNQQSLHSLAVGNKYSAAVFQALVELVYASTEQSKDKTKLTPNAIYALRALRDLAPIDPATSKQVSIQDYWRWIADVANDTKAVRVGLLQDYQATMNKDNKDKNKK